MMRYEAQVIAILPVPTGLFRKRNERRPVKTLHGTRSLGYEVRAPSRTAQIMKI